MHPMVGRHVIWVFISEIFPNSVRAAGQAWGTMGVCCLDYHVREVVGFELDNFAFFAAFMVAIALYALYDA